MENFNDTFLARWIIGEVSSEEELAFKNHPDYAKYKLIKESSETLTFTEFDENESFEALKTKLTTKKTKTNSLYKWIGSIAASAVIAVSFLIFKSQKTIYSSEIAQQNEVTLPDGSTMLLNALSTAKVATKSWNDNRTVFLEGEAFFKVKKGAKFTVKTNLGTIEVLGTEFSVNTVQKDLITVKCFEGKVKVTGTDGNALLTKGMAFQEHNKTIEEWSFEKASPDWLISKETNLHKVSVKQVITLLKRQYNLKIQQQEFIDTTLLFTGNFTNTNLKKALYSVFGTLGINYELISENEIRILLE